MVGLEFVGLTKGCRGYERCWGWYVEREDGWFYIMRFEYMERVGCRCIVSLLSFISLVDYIFFHFIN